MHVAAFVNRVELIKLFVHHGANFMAKDNKGRTPLDVALDRKHKEAA